MDGRGNERGAVKERFEWENREWEPDCSEVLKVNVKDKWGFFSFRTRRIETRKWEG